MKLLPKHTELTENPTARMIVYHAEIKNKFKESTFYKLCIDYELSTSLSRIIFYLKATHNIINTRVEKLL